MSGFIAYGLPGGPRAMETLPRVVEVPYAPPQNLGDPKASTPYVVIHFERGAVTDEAATYSAQMGALGDLLRTEGADAERERIRLELLAEAELADARAAKAYAAGPDRPGGPVNQAASSALRDFARRLKGAPDALPPHPLVPDRRSPGPDDAVGSREQGPSQPEGDPLSVVGPEPLLAPAGVPRVTEYELQDRSGLRTRVRVEEEP